jgi:hypothetical protein
MEDPPTAIPRLQAACADPDSLFTLPEETLLRLVYEAFSQDIDRLKRAYSIRGSHLTSPETPSPSQTLYRQEYDEVNRTLVGFLALRWIHTGQYETFVGTQPPELQLSRESFEWIRTFYSKAIVNSNDLFTLITSIIVNDLGKDPQLATDYYSLRGEDISRLNHDAILLKALKAALVPSLSRLPTNRDKTDVVRAMELGASFNFGQLAQAENAPACLSSLLLMKGEERAFKHRFMEQLLDIAGAAGHMDWTCAKKLIQPIFEAYRAVYDASMGVIAGTLSLRGGYDVVLIRRAELLRGKGFRSLDVGDREDRALMRLLCMGGVADLQTAQLYEGVWGSLDDSTRRSLVHALNIDGSTVEPAVQPTYMPALLSHATDGLPTSEAKARALLTSALRYLAHVMRVTETVDSSAIVIERSLLGVLKKYVESGEFCGDPSILDRADVPDSVVALAG